MRITQEQKVQAVMAMMDAILEVVEESGPVGVPAGPMYAAFMSWGCSLEQFQQLMDGLVRGGFLRHSGHCYFFVKKRKK